MKKVYKHTVGLIQYKILKLVSNTPLEVEQLYKILNNVGKYKVRRSLTSLVRNGLVKIENGRVIPNFKQIKRAKPINKILISTYIKW